MPKLTKDLVKKLVIYGHNAGILLSDPNNYDMDVIGVEDYCDPQKIAKESFCDAEDILPEENLETVNILVDMICEDYEIPD